MSSNKAELFTSSTQWTATTDYPYSTSISRYSMISFESSFVILGGSFKASSYSNKLKAIDIVAKFNSVDSTWKKLGNLQKGRLHHSTIQLGDDIFLVGGFSNKNSSR